MKTFSTEDTAKLPSKPPRLEKNYCMSNQNDWALLNVLIVQTANLPFEHSHKKATNRGLNEIYNKIQEYF